MRPERRGPGRPFTPRREADGEAALPFEPIDTAAVSAVAQMERTLSDAGRRARAARSGDERPDPEFAAALRERLLTQLPAGAATHPAATSARLSTAAPSFGSAGASRRSQADVAAGFNADPRIVAHGRPEPVIGRLAWTGPRLSTPPRWATALVAAVFIVAAIGLGPGRNLFAGPAPSRATDVAGADLIRNGTTTALLDGAELHAGDEVRTAPSGRATLVLGGSLARLDGGSDVVVVSLASDRLALDQRAGRVYHRVLVPDGGSYAVTTAGVTWTAHGTAFDLDRETGASGSISLVVLAVQHDVLVAGPGIAATIAEGRRAEVRLTGTSATPDLSTGAPTSSQLHDPWLAANAGLDETAGFDPGILVALLTSEPSPSSLATASAEPSAGEPTAAPSAEPTVEPDPSSAPVSSPAPTEKPQPTPTETPKPTPTPKPVASLGLVARACPGGTILDWTAAPADGFHHYKTWWSSSASFTDPILVNGSTTTDRSATSTVAAGVSGTRWYRTYAYDAAGHLVAKSPIREATGLGGPGDVGILTIGPDGGGPNTSFGWPELSIADGCYSATKLVYAPDGEPSYGQAGTELLWYGSDSATHAVTTSVPSGTWWFRVQVLYETDLRTVVVGQTAPTQYLVP